MSQPEGSGAEPALKRQETTGSLQEDADGRPSKGGSNTEGGAQIEGGVKMDKMERGHVGPDGSTDEGGSLVA